MNVGDLVILTREGLARLLEALRADGYRLVGPSAQDGAIVYREIQGIADLPAGLTEMQDAC